MTRQVRAAEREMSPALRAELEHRLRPDVQELRRWLGPDFHGWGLLGH
jgi:phage portal protein BeeE